MIEEEFTTSDPRMLAAIGELQRTIGDRHPGATFSVEPGEDPGTVWMWATVDVDDTDDVFDPLLERLLELQIDHGVPLHVFPIRTPERISAALRRRAASNRELALSG